MGKFCPANIRRIRTGQQERALFHTGLHVQMQESFGMNNHDRKQHKPWSAEDEQYLQESWGKFSIPAIGKKLGRSVNAVKVRAQRLGLGAVLMGGDYISLNQLLIAVKGTNFGGGYAIKSWVENRGLPVHTKKVVNNSFRVVYLDEFWTWAEKNRSFIDFSKMEPLALGKEPDWVAEQRKKDFQSFAIQRKDPWTSADDSRLIMLLKEHKYGYAELSELLHRSAGAIQRRCNDLGIKERPVKADNHGQETAWTDNDFSVLADGIRNGDSYTMIGKAIGKSEKAIRGKVYFVYLTESADKVRRMMGDHEWGYGAPIPTVKQAVVLSRTRTETKAMLARLCGVLNHQIRQLKKSDYDYFFQRAVCAHWDDLHSTCSAGGEDCDACADFLRIQPQYCVRCGATFYERAQNRRCPQCRDARKKMGYKKYRRLYGGAPHKEDGNE